jgi:PAS domain S-box-containing protein
MTAGTNSATALGNIIPLLTSTPLQVRPSLIDLLPLAIYACEADGKILWFNSRAADLWGQAPLVGDDSDKYCGSFRLYFNGRQITRDQSPMARVLATGEPIRGAEGRVERPDGSNVWAMVHIEPVYEEGRLLGAINCFHETTALHQAESDLDDFFENTSIGLHLVSDSGTILRANRAELAMMGYTADEYVGQNIKTLHVDSSTVEDILAKLRDRQPLEQCPARLRAKDGSIRHVLITSNPRKQDGQPTDTRCFTLDVTDRIKAEELLREQDRRLEATYDHAGSGIVEVDREGRLLRVNARLCELMGCSPDDLLGRSIFDETFFEDVEADREQFRRQVSGELSRYTIEKRLLRRDGSSFWASVTSTSVLDDRGCFFYAVRVQNDISERKKAQQELAARAQEQAALHRFTDRLQHAHSPDEVYAIALDAIREALRCRRASILLFDDNGVMRFVAWREISDRYRAAVEGHSPWARGEEQPKPIFFADVKEAQLPAPLERHVIDEGIKAVAFIPIEDSSGLLGKFMVYHDNNHAFSDPEIKVALTLARQLGSGIERMRSQKAAQQLVSIVESSHDAIVSKDLGGIIQTWNSGAERLFGYLASEIVGQSITLVIPPERLEEEDHILARIRNGERLDHFETVRRRKDGSEVNVSLTISPVRNAKGRIVGASKIARDITERKEAEAKIKEGAQHLQDLLAAIPAAIYTTDARGKITYFNQAAVELAGRTPTLGSDEFCVTWKLYWPDGTYLPHDQCPMAVSLREGRAVRGVEAVAERPDGTRVPFIPYPTPMRDANGNIVGGINMLVDISERRQAETQQRLLLNELNHRVKNNMQMLQSLLFRASRRSNSQEARDVLEEASGRIASMAAAQRVLYDSVDALKFNGSQFLDAVCQAAQQALPDVTVTFEAISAELSNDVAMPLALIVNELVTNAAKHGVADHADPVIRVTLCRDDEAYILTVADDGPGFELDVVRPQSSGLRLVEGLARQLGGTFSVNRSPGTQCILRFS